VASFWLQLASAIVSGLSFATLLTLIVTPAMLMAPYAVRDLWRKFLKLFSGSDTDTPVTA